MLEHAVLGCSLLETLDVRSCLKVYLFLLLELQFFLSTGMNLSSVGEKIGLIGFGHGNWNCW
jgi:hypothetical protein